MEKAKAAMATARLSEQHEGVVLRRLERAGELLSRAEEMISPEDPPGFLAVYKSARGNLDRAWEFYRSRRYKPALKLADQVERASRKIIDACRRQNREHEQLRRRSEKVKQLIERTRLVVADCELRAAERNLKRAENAFRTANELKEQEGQLQAAWQALRRAREMAAKATQQCLGEDQLAERYQRLLRQAEHLSGLLAADSGASVEAARNLIRQAYDQLDLAREHVRTKQQESALASLKAAQLALSQAQKHLDRR